MARAGVGTALGLIAAGAIAFLNWEPRGFAQQAPVRQEPSSLPSFDVASVRPVRELPDAMFRVENGTLTSKMGITFLISWAYGVPFNQVDAPDWVRLAGTHIIAKAARPVEEDQVRLMLRTLLVDRFHLRVHRETREKRLPALMVDKTIRLRPSKQEGRWQRQFDSVALREVFTGITIPELTSFLAQYSNGCLDRTGLTGRYDFTLNYQGLMDPDAKNQVVELIRVRPEALRQVGLKIEVVPATLEYVVVDHVERIPTEN